MKNHICISLFGGSFIFDDVAIPLYHSFRKLGYNVSIRRNSTLNDATNIIIGIHDVKNPDISNIAEDSIIYNFEQIAIGSKALNPTYISILEKFKIWDYSQENTRRIREILGIEHIAWVPYGYCKEMTRIDENYPQDIDISFYGALSQRRLKILDDLKKLGYKILVPEFTSDLERDILISRSKLMLNIHFYVPGILELLRIGYWWANKKCVLSECNEDTEIQSCYKDSCFYASYDNLCR